MKSLTELVEELARITKLTPIFLSCNFSSLHHKQQHKQHWVVLQPYGNRMALVHGSLKDTPEEAVKFCIRKWNHRSPDCLYHLGSFDEDL